MFLKCKFLKATSICKKKEHFQNYLSRSQVSEATHTNQYSHFYQYSLQELTHIIYYASLSGAGTDGGLFSFPNSVFLNAYCFNTHLWMLIMLRVGKEEQKI